MRLDRFRERLVDQTGWGQYPEPRWRARGRSSRSSWAPMALPVDAWPRALLWGFWVVVLSVAAALMAIAGGFVIVAAFQSWGFYYPT